MPARARRRPAKRSASLCLLLSASRSSPPLPAVSARFEPYELNGGLVSAVAGRDYVVIASDTRLTDGGYQIKSRGYLDGRVWAASGPSVLDCDLELGRTALGGGGEDAGEGAGGMAEPAPFGPDGSLRIPRSESDVPVVRSDAAASSSAATVETLASAPARRTSVGRRIADPYGLTLVGSAGCASDCEALKRTVRSELSDRSGWTSPSSSASPWGGGPCSSSSSARTADASTIATLLLQTLYSRRPFPYYAFCVLAGLDASTGSGVVHVYDAIGSHERVAVACAGTPGREMLQPVLDRMFASTSGGTSGGAGSGGGAASGGRTDPASSSLVRDGTAVGAEGQRVGTSLTLRPPVGTCVGCGPEEAVALLVRAYRSVAEREIGVGDDLVVCVLRRDGGAAGETPKETGGRGSLEVMRFPLKKH